MGGGLQRPAGWPVPHDRAIRRDGPEPEYPPLPGHLPVPGYPALPPYLSVRDHSPVPDWPAVPARGLRALPRRLAGLAPRDRGTTGTGGRRAAALGYLTVPVFVVPLVIYLSTPRGPGAAGGDRAGGAGAGRAGGGVGGVRAAGGGGRAGHAGVPGRGGPRGGRGGGGPLPRLAPHAGRPVAGCPGPAPGPGRREQASHG